MLDIPLAVDIRADFLAQPLCQRFDPMLNLTGLPPDRHPHGNLGEVGPKGQLSFVFGNHAGYQFIQPGLANTEGLKRPGQKDIAPTPHFPNPGHHAFFHHGFHLARHTRQDDQMLAPVRCLQRQAIARCRPEMIGNNGRSSGELRLLEIILRHGAVQRGKNPPDILSHFFREGQLDSGNLGDQFGREVIRRGSNAPRRNNHVGLRHGLFPGPHNPLRHIANRDNRGHV